jgi:hypothetical protein
MGDRGWGIGDGGWGMGFYFGVSVYSKFYSDGSNKKPFSTPVLHSCSPLPIPTCPLVGEWVMEFYFGVSEIIHGIL